MEHNTHWEALVPASLTLSMVLPMPLARMFPSIVNILSADIPPIPLISNIPTLTPTWSSEWQRLLVLGNLSLLYLSRSKQCRCIIIGLISLVSGFLCWHWVLVTADSSAGQHQTPRGSPRSIQTIIRLMTVRIYYRDVNKLCSGQSEASIDSM